MVARVSPNWTISKDKVEVKMYPFGYLDFPLT